MGFLVALGVFAAAIVLGIVFFSTGHVVLGIIAMLGSLPFALASWLKWADRPRRLLSRKTVTSDAPRTRTEDTRSPIPDGMERRSSPGRTQK